MLSKDCTLDEVRAYFADDRFATEACGCSIVSAEPGHAVCELAVGDVHRNAQGQVMGGAIFTLADFALAVAANVGETPTVTLTSTIEYLGPCRGKRLQARCNADRSGRSVGFYVTDVADELGNKVACVVATAYRRR